MSGDGYLALVIIGLVLAVIALVAKWQHDDLEEAYRDHVERTEKK